MRGKGECIVHMSDLLKTTQRELLMTMRSKQSAKKLLVYGVKQEQTGNQGKKGELEKLTRPKAAHSPRVKKENVDMHSFP